ncbi:MAG: hypothetical protein ACQUHE_13205 [Bacteroidia bacterium]
MKLFLVFDNEKNKINELCIEASDQVISNGKIDVKGSNYDINDCEINYLDYYQKWSLAFKKLYDDNRFSKDNQDLLIAAAPNIYLHNFRYLILWVEAVKDHLENKKYDEIVISDLVRSNYFPYYEAEGEVNSGIFYKKYDFIPYRLFEYIKENYPEISINIVRRKSRISLAYRIFNRRYTLLLVKFFLHLKNILLSSKPMTVDTSNLKFLFVSRGLAHTNYIKKFFTLNDQAFVHGSDGLFSNGENTLYLKKIKKNRVITLYEYLGVLDLINSFLRLVIRMSRTKLKKIKVNGVTLCLNSLFKEVIISQLEVDLHTRSVFNFSQRINSPYKLLTCEMVSSYPLFTKLSMKSDINCLATYQLQTTSLDLFECPNFVHTDTFLFKSKNDLQFFEKIFEKSKLDFIGNLSYHKGNGKKVRKELKNIIYFTQPYELSVQIRIVKYLYALSSKLNINLHVKPHPREDLEGLKHELSAMNISYLPKEADIDEIGKLADLVIIRTSSLTQDLFLNFIPTINILLSDFDRNIKVEYLTKGQLNIVENLHDLDGFLTSYDVFCTEFRSFCSLYLSEVGITKDRNDFLNEITLNTRDVS